MKRLDRQQNEAAGETCFNSKKKTFTQYKACENIFRKNFKKAGE